MNKKNTVKVIKMQTGSHIEVVSPDRYYAYVYCPVHFMSWWRGTVVERRSLAGELSLSCARPAADG